MDELNYSANEEFCKETMLMMREFIGRASHLLDCADAKIKKAKRTARNKAVDDFISRLENHTQENWIDHQEYGITWDDINKIAEEMKNEQSNSNYR